MNYKRLLYFHKALCVVLRGGGVVQQKLLSRKDEFSGGILSLPAGSAIKQDIYMNHIYIIHQGHSSGSFCW